MSIKLARHEIERFLSSSAPEVLCIKGKWGVGKTYTLNQLILSARNNKSIALPYYAYVSLFGRTTLDDLKIGIVENTLPKEKIGTSPTLETVLSDPSGAAKSFWRKTLPYMGWLPGIGDAAHLIRSLSFLKIQDQIICLDDLERKGDSLRIKDVLGLVSVLKEQKRCKVILILNDGAFEDDEKDDFNTYFEKTVDSHVTFAPTPQECADIALPGTDATSAILRERVSTLGISNIRIIRRIARLASMITPALDKYHESIAPRFLAALVVIGWSHFGDDAPTVDFLRTWRRYKAEKIEPTENERRWATVLETYNQGMFLEEDEILWQAVAQGFFDIAAVEGQASLLHRSALDQEARNAFSAAWRLYHDTLEPNDEVFISALSKAFKNNVAQVSVGNADGAISVLRDIGQEQKAKELVAYYLANIKEDSAFDPSNLFQPIQDSEFSAAVAERLEEKTDSRQLVDVLLSIVQRSGWSPGDEKKLASSTVDDFYEAFRSYQGEHLTSLVKVPLTFGFKEEGIRVRAVEALNRISGESPLNNVRVKQKFGIET